MPRKTPAPLAIGGNGGRDHRGRFASGNPGGPGNPLVKRVAAYRAALLEAVSTVDRAARAHRRPAPARVTCAVEGAGPCPPGEGPCPRRACRYWLPKGACALALAREGPQTLEAIGGYLGLSKQRVAQIEIAALAKLRAALARRAVGM